MITGRLIILDAKITGITPAVLTLSGITEPLPDDDALPTSFPEYWTGISLLASSRITESAMIAIRTPAIIRK